MRFYLKIAALGFQLRLTFNVIPFSKPDEGPKRIPSPGQQVTQGFSYSVTVNPNKFNYSRKTDIIRRLLSSTKIPT